MIIIHGENTTESRKKLDDVLQSKKNIKRFDGKSLKPDAIPLLFESSELFAEEKTIIIENCKALSKQSLESIIKVQPAEEITLIFWQDGNYDARLIKKFPHATVYAFPLPKYFFSFLDGLAPGKGAYLHSVYIPLLQSFVPEQVFFSMVKRIRHLLLLKSGQGSEVEELAKMSDWQRNKLIAQSRSWNPSQLKSFYQKLYMTEKGIKTSTLPSNLMIHLDNLILSELQ